MPDFSSSPKPCTAFPTISATPLTLGFLTPPRPLLPSSLLPRPSSPQTLATEVAHYLGLELGKIKCKRFADGEIYVQVQVSAGVRQRKGWGGAAWGSRSRVRRWAARVRG